MREATAAECVDYSRAPRFSYTAGWRRLRAQHLFQRAQWFWWIRQGSGMRQVPPAEAFISPMEPEQSVEALGAFSMNAPKSLRLRD